MTSMRRPGPLKDLPLEPLLAPNLNHPDHLNPAKRRILNEEGILCTEKSLRTSRTRVSPASFLSNSPAKKLDFGTPKGPQHPLSTSGYNAVSRNHPQSCSNLSSSQCLAPAIHQPSTSSFTLDEAPSAAPRRSPRLRASLPHPAPILIPRDTPPPPDRQSIHYPGFDVLQDMYTQHIPLPANLETLQGERSLEEIKVEKEGYKENMAPKKKAKKTSTAPNSQDLIKIALRTPEAKRREVEGIIRTSTTARKSIVSGREIATRPTPRRPTLCSGTIQLHISPPPATPEERRERRQILEDEVNNISDDDEDILTSTL